MMPNTARPPMGGPPPGGPPGQGGGAGEPSPEQVKQMLVQVLTQAKQLADKYGIDLVSLIPQGGRAGPAGVPPPPGPSAPPEI